MATFNFKDVRSSGRTLWGQERKRMKVLHSELKKSYVDHFSNLSKLKEKRVNWASEIAKKKKKEHTPSTQRL